MNYFSAVKNKGVTHQLVNSLRHAFEQHASREKAEAMSAYMKNLFPFLGLQKPLREMLFKDWLKENGASLKTWNTELLTMLWEQPEREFQYVAMVLMNKWKKQLKKEQEKEIEFYLTHGSWWDTVDFLAATIAGQYFLLYPEMTETVFSRWNRSGNLWLNRSAILFQLKYGKATDLSLLDECIERHKNSKEFFHRKAIGWALRTLYKHFPEYVSTKAEKGGLSNLSIREALKHAGK